MLLFKGKTLMITSGKLAKGVRHQCDHPNGNLR